MYPGIEMPQIKMFITIKGGHKGHGRGGWVNNYLITMYWFFGARNLILLSKIKSKGLSRSR